MQGKKLGLQKQLSKATQPAKGQQKEDPKPKKGRSGRSNWQKFNAERKALAERMWKQRHQTVPRRRCRGKQTCTRRWIQRAVRLDISDAEEQTAEAGLSGQKPRLKSQGTQTELTCITGQSVGAEESASEADEPPYVNDTACGCLMPDRV